jgi:hypothetical protein
MGKCRQGGGRQKPKAESLTSEMRLPSFGSFPRLPIQSFMARRIIMKWFDLTSALARGGAF